MLRAKRERLQRYRRAFNEAIANGSPGLVHSSPSQRGTYENEIGTVFFGSETNKVSDVLREWPAFHRAFLARLHAEGLIPPDHGAATGQELAVQP